MFTSRKREAYQRSQTFFKSHEPDASVSKGEEVRGGGGGECGEVWIGGETGEVVRLRREKG